MTHLENSGQILRNEVQHTVDSNCHDFCQDEPIGSHERWNAVQRIELEVLGVCVWGLRLDELDVEVVGFGNGEQNSGSGIALRFSQSLSGRSLAG
jgi:hypothetical protein